MKRKNNIVILITFYFFIFFFISIAYSFLNENLEIKGTVSIVTEKDYEYSYIYNGGWQDSGFNYYYYTPTVTYLKNEEVIGWQVNIKVPTDAEVVGCYNASECVVIGDNLRIKNASWNGLLTPENNTFSFGFQIKTMAESYDFEITSIKFFKNGDYSSGSDDEKVMLDQFEVKMVSPNFWGNTTQFDFEIYNNSDFSLQSWSLSLKIPEGTAVEKSWGVNYILKENEIILSGLTWNQYIYSKSSITGMGIQLINKDSAPLAISINSLTGLTIDQEEVEIKL